MQHLHQSPPVVWAFRVAMLAALVLILATSGARWIVSAQGDDTLPSITSEDAANLSIRTLLVQHTADIIEMDFTPRGSAFTTGGLDGQFCVWNVDPRRAAPGTLFFCDTDYIPGVTAYAWSPDEKRLAATSANGTTIKLRRVYRAIAPENWNTNNYLVIEHPADATILSMHFITGALLVYDINDVLTLYDWQTGAVVTTFNALDVTIHPDNTRFAVITTDDRLLLVDGRSGETVFKYPIEAVAQVVFAPNGERLATAGETIDLWNVVAGPEQPLNQTRIINDDAEQLSFTPDSKFLVTTLDNQITLRDANTGVVANEIVLNDAAAVEVVEFTTDVTRAVVLNNAGMGLIMDVAEDGQLSERLVFRNRVDRVYLSPDNTSLIVARVEFFARLYDVQRGQLRGRYEIPPDSEISPNWQFIATRRNNIVAWHALNRLDTTFAFEPVATTEAALNIRETPSTELARIAVIDAFRPVFALGRSEDAEWLYVVLPDGTRGWTFLSSSLNLNVEAQILPVISP